MMQEFSQRTIDELNQKKLFKLLLPPFQSFLESNVDKEIEKTRFAIYKSADARKNHRQPGNTDTEQLLQKAREIDQEFLRKASSLSSAINIQYHDIERIRKNRIDRLLGAAYHILKKWEDVPQFRVVVAGLYTRKQFHTLLYDILSLYIDETRILSNSVKIPRNLSFVRDSLLQTIHSVMEKVAEELAIELTGKIYKDRGL
ncbi:MAG: hypothetical protein MAG794_00537 [Gammaproteobacteria bacterium]|nr:hypothetical protein [Gammaproteobacteria bacterium]